MNDIKKTSEIKIEVGLDENHIPVKMTWSAEDGAERGVCKALMLALWDEKEENTMRIDLWNKDMNVYDMQRFFHQSLLTMADTYGRATGQEEVVSEIKTFAKKFAEKTRIIS